MLVSEALTEMAFAMCSAASSSRVLSERSMCVSASLTSIDLSYNHLGPEGAKHIAKGIAVSASLTDINLSDNILTNYGQDVSGVQAIADALRFSASLIAADLRRNCLDADTKQELRNAMNDRPSFELNL